MFAELCCTSNFTFLTGASHPEEYVMRAHTLGYSGVGITDEASVSGAGPRASHSQTLNIPLIHGSRFRIDEQFELTLLAPSRTAWGAGTTYLARTTAVIQGCVSVNTT